VSPIEWSPCSPRTIQPPLTASPCNRLSRSRSTISQSDFHPIIRPFSPYRLVGSYKLALEPDGSPLFISIPLVACWRYEPREHRKPLALTRPAIPPSPERDRVGYSDHDRFRGYFSVHWCSCLQPSCLRFAAAVTGRHARLGTRLLARLCRGRHLRRLSSIRFQGATRSSNRTCRFAASGFPTGFIVRPTATTVGARVEGIALPIPRRRARGRTDLCHVLALCVVCGGSFSRDHRHVDRRLHTPRQERHRRSTRTNRPEGGSIAFALQAKLPCCPASAARRFSS
jgi:hypothetical protein